MANTCRSKNGSANMSSNLYKKTNVVVIKMGLILSIAVGFYSTVSAKMIYVESFDSSLTSEKITESDDSFDAKFREARDLIDREEWAKAAAKFNEVIDKNPDNKSADAALYWLAFCYKKQKLYKETAATLDRLLKEYPSSSWADDAKVMKLEITVPLGNVYFASAAKATHTLPPAAEIYTPSVPTEMLKATDLETVSKYFDKHEITEVYSAQSRPQLDREDEIKIAAFQSLLSADQKRGIEVMGEVLKPDSKASETFKLEMLRVLRSPRLLSGQTMNVFTSGVNKQFTPLLRETLMKSFQAEPNVKIRKELIYALANINDDQTANYLVQLYSAETDQEIKKAIINSLGNQYGSFGLYSNSGQNLFGTTISKTAASTIANNNPNRQVEFDKLLEIVRAEKNVELRRLAFSTLQRMRSFSSDDRIINIYSEMYDAETDEVIKISIIQALAASKQNQAAKKLLEIARSDKSEKLRLEAIYALRTSKNPEALKFLENLIK